MIRISRPSPSMVVALIALMVALGGTGYAAIKLPANSVGSKQIKKNAVTGAKVKNRSLTAADFKKGSLPAGQKGDTGAKGETGPKGDPGQKGDKGDTGAAGAPAPAGATLAPGATEKGAFGIGNPAGSMNDTLEGAISYPLPLAANPIPEVVQQGDPATANCPGSPANPQAAAGYLCIYVDYANQLSAIGVKFFGTDGDDTPAGEFRFGVVVYAKALGALPPEAAGTWAVTAP
jgi:hypothetical protein